MMDQKIADAKARMAEVTELMRFMGNGELGMYQSLKADRYMTFHMKELVKAASREDLDLMLPKLPEPMRELIEHCKLLVKIDYLEAELNKKQLSEGESLRVVGAIVTHFLDGKVVIDDLDLMENYEVVVRKSVLVGGQEIRARVRE